MNILDKISTIKAVSNLIVLRSKYDKVCDELAYRELEANKSNDLIETIEPMLKESLDKVESLSFNNYNLKREVSSLEEKNKALKKERNNYYERYLEESRFIYLWWLTGFATGVFVWAMIIKYLFV